VVQDKELSLAVSYGAKPMQLPFSLKLYDFQMERYPGTNSAASYASEVQLIDPASNVSKDFRIYMNNILNYRGFRFFQSSFDQDEQGTYLSVNHDFWGTWISYFGYALLTIGMIMIFISRRTRFYKVSQMIGGLKTGLIILACSFALSTNAQKNIDPVVNSVDTEHARSFSRIIVQDFKGRMKPVHTLSREILRKVSRKERLFGLSADQILLSMFADKSAWLSRPMIKVSPHENLAEMLGSGDDLISYKDFFTVEGRYKLQDEVRRAYSLQPIDRGQFEKDIMKIDERINLVSMVFSGAIFKIIPLENSENNEWVGAVSHHGNQNVDANVADRFFPNYRLALNESLSTNDYSLPDQIIEELMVHQTKYGQDVIPGPTKVKAEILLNNLNVFNKLSAYYSILGLAYLLLLFTTVFKPGMNITKVSKILLTLLLFGFLLHTIGLGLRWYVSERAPWSNGYESMIYIAWTSTLAGIIFTRKSLGGLAATMILAGTILLVAMLSYLDPEITPLVPVLRSYWLTIHVSLIAGSYGFLMLGAIIGIINLILMIFLKTDNQKRIRSIIQEMTNISELTITGGLVMISIGTYLGGVWANESWGRYWGWDAKETWALVTILVYAFILHMRLIPKMYSLFSFNVATLFGFASVVMTYFGVNYYLSGLHSYAAGDPVPIPNWVYIAVSSVLIISIVAYIKKRKVQF
jgi:cytochrome c-type biogenesis protein CcsB